MTKVQDTYDVKASHSLSLQAHASGVRVRSSDGAMCAGCGYLLLNTFLVGDVERNSKAIFACGTS